MTHGSATLQPSTNTRSARKLPEWIWQWLAVVAVAVVLIPYYSWEVRAAGYRFDWKLPQNGYYNYLARGFTRGHLFVPIEPNPKLLAQPNPWDPNLDESLKMHDMVLFGGRYYLYHGAGPALMLFAPYRLLTGRDLPERFALCLMCFGGWLFSCAAMLRMLALYNARVHPLLLILMFLALGVCQSVPYLLVRVWVYEIAIAGGYFCVAAAFFFLTHGMSSASSPAWLAGSGLMFGMAIACRPHLGIAGIFALAGLLAYRARTQGLKAALRSRGIQTFAICFAAIGIGVALYNYARFGNPFEFGLRYLMSGGYQNRIKLQIANLLPGFYYWFACPPEAGSVFPWLRLITRPPFNSPGTPFPPEYFLEPTVGAFFLAPFLPAALLAFFLMPHRNDGREQGKSEVAVILWILIASTAAVVLFLAASGFTTQRYEVDFLPMLALVALTVLALSIAALKGIARALVVAATVVCIVCGLFVSAALGLQGPYDEIRKNRPQTWTRLADRFHPRPELRPLINPAVDVAFTAEFRPQPDGISEPLLTLGPQGNPYILYVRHAGAKLQMISHSEHSSMEREVDPQDAARAQIHVQCAPGSSIVHVTVNGREYFQHDIAPVVIAPVEVSVGTNETAPNTTLARFTGQITSISTRISVQ